MTTYTIQTHQPSGETYMLRYDDTDTITGVCGSLSHDEWSDDGGYTVRAGFDPSNGEFSAEDAEWANTQEWGAPKDIPTN